MKLIVGLGNPGRQYARTRHNVGFMVVDYLAERLGIKVDQIKFKSLVGEGLINSEKVILVKPQTYMNQSGEAVFEIVRWYKPALADILVVFDDLDLPPGKLRLRIRGSAGGHNGMKSIIYLLQSDEFPRLRIGIGRPEDENTEPVDYVLSKLGKEEAKVMAEAVKAAGETVISILEKGVEQVMNKMNVE